MDVHAEEKRIKHYTNQQKILLVGEGDFSFALSLANAFGSAPNMVATTRDSKESLFRNYSRASTHLESLEKLGCTILHEVNANTMNDHPHLLDKLFDRIVFNFPHDGLFFEPESSWSQIRRHQMVVRGFLNSAWKMLSQDGQIHITHKTARPYCNWEIVSWLKKLTWSCWRRCPLKEGIIQVTLIREVMVIEATKHFVLVYAAPSNSSNPLVKE